jgi:hypothetical protein
VPDRLVLQLRTAVASNTGGPYTATWDRAVVPATGTIRSATVHATSVTSNARKSSVDIYIETGYVAADGADGTSPSSNTAVPILVTPLALTYDDESMSGTIRERNKRVRAGDVLQLRTDSGNIAAKPAFTNLSASVEIERDPE